MRSSGDACSLAAVHIRVSATDCSTLPRQYAMGPSAYMLSCTFRRHWYMSRADLEHTSTAGACYKQVQHTPGYAPRNLIQ